MESSLLTDGMEKISNQRPMVSRLRRSFAVSTGCQHGGRVRSIGASIGRKRNGLLEFSASINPMGPPPLKEILEIEMSDLIYYPDNTYREFREAAAEYVGVNPECIIPGNGSSEIIRLFVEATLMEGQISLIPTPTFGEYSAQSRLMGAEVLESPLGVGEPRPLDQVFPDELLDRAQSTFFCNPNNPTGRLMEGEQVAELARRARDRETFLLVDEAFIELSEPKESIAQLAPEMDNLVVMRSLTKAFAVPGLRLGFGVANPDLARIIDRARIPWSLGSLSAAAGTYLLRMKDYLQASREFIRKERGFLRMELTALGLRPMESDANYLLVDVRPSGLPSGTLTSAMLEQGILIRDCASFGLGSSYVRLAVRTRDENLQLLSALGKVLPCSA